MRIMSWVPVELREKYEQALQDCVKEYPSFDVENPLHQMFAVQIMLMREAAQKYGKHLE
jgi:hypothetical protein